MFLYQQFASRLDRHTDFPPLRYTAEPYYLTEPPDQYLRSVLEAGYCLGSLPHSRRGPLADR